MPFYDYRCCDCGNEDELMVSMSEHDNHGEDKNLPACEKCVDGFMMPQINKGTSFQLKGKWFKEGY